MENNLGEEIESIIDIENNQDNECPICLNIIEENDLCITNCDHFFCLECLNQWIKINNNCPTCREEIISYKNNNETNRLIFINNNEELLNIGELENIIYNAENNMLINYKNKILLKITSTLSIIFLMSSVYSYTNCNYRIP